MKKYTLLALATLAIATIVAIASVWHDSPVVDEIPHIGAGYSYVVEHAYKYNPEHPPLAKDLAGLALLPLHLNQSALYRSHQINYGSDVHGQWDLGRDLIFTSGNNAITLVHAAKLPMLLFFIFSGLIVFFWTRKLSGDKTALLATFLFAFSPTIIAHSRLVTTDMAALFGVLFGTLGVITFLEKPSVPNFWIAAAAIGVSLITKFSTFLLLPYFVLITLMFSFAHHRRLSVILKDAGKMIVAIIMGFVIIVGPVYQLHLLNYPPASQKADAAIILDNYQLKPAADLVLWASDKPVIRPIAQYALGLLMVFQRNEGGNLVYFLGKLDNDGSVAYFPVVFALKEPLPFLILILFALIGTLFMARRSTLRAFLAKYFAQVAMALWIAIYGAFSLTAKVDIGIRHLMPIYGFLFILTAGQAVRFYEHLGHKKLIRWLGFGLLAWYLVEFIGIYPYYLSYFNEFAGGPAGGYRYVADSNLDWGQDLWRLADYVKENNIQKISLDYFGWADQAYYIGDPFVWITGGQYVSAQQFLHDNPGGGWIAISATFYDQSLHDTNQHYAWLKAYPPTTVIGHSIFVWHITE